MTIEAAQLGSPPPITGRAPAGPEASPERALSDFYAAFNGRDLARMEQVWSHAPDTALDNPVGGIRRGWPEIREVYRRIFASPAQVEVEFFDYTLHPAGDLFYAVGRERGHVRLPGAAAVPLAIRTTRVFRREAGAWRQVHHHGSFDDPAMLAAYQAAVGFARPAP